MLSLFHKALVLLGLMAGLEAATSAVTAKRKYVTNRKPGATDDTTRGAVEKTKTQLEAATS